MKVLFIEGNESMSIGEYSNPRHIPKKQGYIEIEDSTFEKINRLGFKEAKMKIQITKVNGIKKVMIKSSKRGGK